MYLPLAASVKTWVLLADILPAYYLPFFCRWSRRWRLLLSLSFVDFKSFLGSWVGCRSDSTCEKWARVQSQSNFGTWVASLGSERCGSVTAEVWQNFNGESSSFFSLFFLVPKGVNAIVYVCDSADHDTLEVAKNELHDLMQKPALASIPLLVLGNKNDLPQALSVDELIQRLWVFSFLLRLLVVTAFFRCSNLKDIAAREVCCYSISAKSHNNIDLTLEWLTKRARPQKSWTVALLRILFFVCLDLLCLV